jgi:hypothetical protein
MPPLQMKYCQPHTLRQSAGHHAYSEDMFCATGAFDGDAVMLAGLPAWPAHLEYQGICGPSPGQALH